MRILGLDWGTVRVGAAMSDEAGSLAFPLQDPLNSKTAIAEIKKLTEEYGIAKIIIGRPVAMSGQETESTAGAEKFGEKLKKLLPVPIEYVDERLSSVASGKSLHDQGIKEKDQRQLKDNIAAALLLQQYLDTKK